MKCTSKDPERDGREGTRRRRRARSLAAALALLALGPWLPEASRAGSGAGGVCAATASAQLDACKAEVRVELSLARARCLNVPDAAARVACFDAARSARQEGAADCRDQRDARRSLCADLGGGPYAPSFDPADFDSDFSSAGNPYFPLAIGDRWVYDSGSQTVTVEVLPETKRIEGVPCVVVHDRVEEAGEPVEDTDDWLGERLDGTIDYCGELSRSFERFPGDEPPLAELVSLEGSWKAGREGALPGTLFPGAPAVGRVYRQEWLPGIAEDAARVLSTTYAFGSDPELDGQVPQALAEALCGAADCVVTGELTPIDPEAFERKYYARGVGLFLEVDPVDQEVVRLVDCNVDAACQSLPAP